MSLVSLSSRLYVSYYFSTNHEGTTGAALLGAVASKKNYYRLSQQRVLLHLPWSSMKALVEVVLDRLS